MAQKETGSAEPNRGDRVRRLLCFHQVLESFFRLLRGIRQGRDENTESVTAVCEWIEVRISVATKWRAGKGRTAEAESDLCFSEQAHRTQFCCSTN